MITVRRTSFLKERREDEPSRKHFGDVTEALMHMTSLLRAGGTVSSYRGRIYVTTKRGDRTDEERFNGKRNEMDVLTNFVHLAEEGLEDAPSLLVHPELKTILLSSEPTRRMKIAALIACGVNCPVEVKANDHRTIEDLITAAGLFRSGECATISDAFDTLVA